MITAEKRKNSPLKGFSPDQKVHGVLNVLRKRNFSKEEYGNVIYAYIEYMEQDEEMAFADACAYIQTDFDSFIKFIREWKTE